MHSRQHRQVPAMSRLSKIHMVIVIIVFLVLHIRAADDKEKMNKVAAAMVKRRHRAAGRTKKTRDNHDLKYLFTRMGELSSTMRAREGYVPVGLTREDLLQDPSPGDSRERLNALMKAHAYQYERFGRIQEYSQRLANLMQRYLSLEVKHGVSLGVVAPHIQTILTPNGESSHEWDSLICKLRRQRDNVDQLIGKMMKNKIRVSPKDAMDESVLGLSLRFSPEGCTMEPNSKMLDEWLHRVMEYNALWSEMCRYKSKQLRVVLKDASTPPELREKLQCRQREVLEQRGTYFPTACKYAQELIERDVYASLPLDGKRPPFDANSISGGGDEVHISEGNAPGASSEWVEPNYDLEDWNMLSQILESGGPSVPFQELLVDNQA
ncbi:hypothetical protein SeLEV6574_g06145, partial [Synchytrium endobioticum]